MYSRGLEASPLLRENNLGNNWRGPRSLFLLLAQTGKTLGTL